MVAWEPVSWTEEFAAFITSYRCVENLSTLCSCTSRSQFLCFLPQHNGTFFNEMILHANVRILSRRDSDWSIAQRTARSYSVVLTGIVIRALVSFNLEMFLTKRFLAMLTLEWQEIDEVAGGMRALFANS